VLLFLTLERINVDYNDCKAVLMIMLLKGRFSGTGQIFQKRSLKTTTTKPGKKKNR